MARKAWITAAITGGIHTPSMSQYLPVTQKQIIDNAVEAYEAGAAIVHIHARNPETGMPSSDIRLFEEIISGIKKQCPAIICITTGGSPKMNLEERLAPIPVFKPELASLNAGSINFTFSVAVEALKGPGPKFDWEASHLESSYDNVFSNSFKSLEKYALAMNEAGTRPEFEIYDTAMISNIAYFIKKGIVKSPPYIQFILGIMGGLPAKVENLVMLLNVAREILGEFHWSVGVAGKAEFPMAAAALAMGGNIRVGLEDNLYLRPGILAKSNAELVRQAVGIAELLSLEIASPEEVRQIMNLKGEDNVSF